MKRSFSALYFSVRAIMCVRRLETRVPLHEQGACCEQRPAALKRLLTCSAPAANSALLCPAKLHCNQLVAIFNYNTWAALTRQPRPWKPAGALVGGGEEVQGGGGSLAGACGQGLARVKGNEVVLLIYCCVDFCSLCVEIGDWRCVMEPTDRWNEWMIKKTIEPSSQLLRMMDVRRALLKLLMF